MLFSSVDDSALAQFRQVYYGLLVALLAREPSAELMATLAQDIEARADAADELHPELGQGWRNLRAALRELDLAAARDAFTRLFLGPFAPEINPYESHYLTGRLFGEPLVEVRGFMATVGLEREPGRMVEPEDFLAFELEIMNWLVSRQLEAQDGENESLWLRRQAEFLGKHLLIWGPACAEDLQRAREPVLYDAVGLLLHGFLELERRHFAERGLLTEVETLEHARERLRDHLAWKGPLYDPGALPEGAEAEDDEDSGPPN